MCHTKVHKYLNVCSYRRGRFKIRSTPLTVFRARQSQRLRIDPSARKSTALVNTHFYNFKKPCVLLSLI